MFDRCGHPVIETIFQRLEKEEVEALDLVEDLEEEIANIQSTADAAQSDLQYEEEENERLRELIDERDAQIEKLTQQINNLGGVPV